VTVKGSVLKQMEDLKEETGLTCCICREGYRNQPTKVCAVGVTSLILSYKETTLVFLESGNSCALTADI